MFTLQDLSGLVGVSLLLAGLFQLSSTDVAGQLEPVSVGRSCKGCPPSHPSLRIAPGSEAARAILFPALPSLRPSSVFATLARAGRLRSALQTAFDGPCWVAALMAGATIGVVGVLVWEWLEARLGPNPASKSQVFLRGAAIGVAIGALICLGSSLSGG